MAKKKKIALKPVARVFATTSQPKKPEEEPEQESEEATSAPTVEVQQATEQVSTASTNPAGTVDDWEKEVDPVQERLQGYVERLQEKGDKEVARIIKAIEFDKRMNKGLVYVDVMPDVRDEALALRMEQDQQSAKTTSSKPVDKSQAMREKSLLRLYIIHHVLTKLGYTETRTLECLQALGPRLVTGAADDRINSGWEDALDWMWLHCSDDELKAVTA